MNDSDLKFYGTYAPLLQLAEQTLLDELNRIIRSASPEAERHLAEHVLSRIKSAESTREKLKSRGLPPTAKSALKHLSDGVGIRIVTHFIGDVYAILQQIQNSSCWKVGQIKDYIAAPKKNGYRSLHVIVKLPFADDELPEISAEIQLRTIAMDCWASLEHQLKYKKTITNAALIGKELQRCADEMASTDLTLQTIRDMIWAENKGH